MMKRVIAMLMCLVTLCTLVPVSVFAAEENFVEVEKLDASSIVAIDNAEEKVAAEGELEAVAEEAEMEAQDEVDLSAYPALANFGVQSVDVGDHLYYEKEPNNTFATSNIIRNDYTVYGTLRGSDCKDLFTFTLSQPSKVIFVVVSKSSYFNLGIFNSKQKLIGSDMSGTRNSSGNYSYGLVSNGNLSAGRYYAWLENFYQNDSYLLYLSIKPLVSTPGKPTVKISNVASSGKIKLTWNATSYADDYQIYRATSKSGTYKHLATTSKTSYTDKSAKAGKKYYYKVRAVSDNGKKSSFSSIVSDTCNLARPDVSIKLKSGDPKLSWDKISGASWYDIYRATSKNGTYKQIAATTSTSYTDKKAKAGKTYYYKVKAGSSSAKSAYSSVDKIKAK